LDRRYGYAASEPNSKIAGERLVSFWNALPLAGKTIRPAPAFLVFIVAGCSPFVMVPENVSRSAANGNNQETNTSAEAKPTRPSPRTLPQALHAYCECLRFGPPPEAEKNQDKEKPPPAKEETNQEKEKGKPEAKKEKDETKEKEEKKDEEKPAEEGEKKKEEEPKETWYSAHAQATMVTQTHDAFPSPYIGGRSLLPVEPSPTSVTATLFLDARLWEADSWSGELVVNPEMSGGRGFSGVVGLAGFPNGEITRIGVVEPTPYFARLFLRQTWGLGDEQEKVEDEANQIAGSRDVDRITLMVGKLAATDLVDDNRYSHDPRVQYLNWALIYNGAWDYPANVRGYTYGVGIDFNQKNWAFRYGIFAQPSFAQGAPLDPKFLKANGQVTELEARYTLNDQPGKLRLLAFLNRAHMGDYRETLDQMPVNPDITQTRAYRFKYGLGASWDQEITKDFGLFARLGWDDGHTESWAFTEIDRTAVLGFVLNGRCWCRKQDQVGLAGVINGLSGDHRNYLGAGGLGFQIGDGRLRYGPEEILETFYNFAVAKGINVTFDFQEVNHPAYNRDRGPVSIYTLRVHIEN
jgi:high affinity Mn2+ porin